MYIKSIVDRVVSYCGVRSPYKIAKQLNIMILYEPLGTIRGYYSSSKRHKFIHINSDLPEHLGNFVCAHELGHAILHPDTNTPFLRNNTLLSVNRLEIEANQFAAYLLLTDEDLNEYIEYGYTSEQISMYSGLPEPFVRYRFKTLESIN